MGWQMMKGHAIVHGQKSKVAVWGSFDCLVTPFSAFTIKTLVPSAISLVQLPPKSHAAQWILFSLALVPENISPKGSLYQDFDFCTQVYPSTLHTWKSAHLFETCKSAHCVHADVKSRHQWCPTCRIHLSYVRGHLDGMHAKTSSAAQGTLLSWAICRWDTVPLSLHSLPTFGLVHHLPAYRIPILSWQLFHPDQLALPKTPTTCLPKPSEPPPCLPNRKPHHGRLRHWRRGPAAGNGGKQHVAFGKRRCSLSSFEAQKWVCSMWKCDDMAVQWLHDLFSFGEKNRRLFIRTLNAKDRRRCPNLVCLLAICILASWISKPALLGEDAWTAWFSGNKFTLSTLV